MGDTPNDLVVFSPVRRVRIKAATPLVAKRSQRYCQKDDCVFNRMRPGQPVRTDVGVEFCVWCDDSLMAQYLQGGGQ